MSSGAPTAGAAGGGDANARAVGAVLGLLIAEVPPVLPGAELLVLTRTLPGPPPTDAGGDERIDGQTATGSAKRREHGRKAAELSPKAAHSAFQHEARL